MIKAAENSGKLFTLLFNGDDNNKDRLLLPNASHGSPSPEKIDEELPTKVAQEATLQPGSIPPPTGYIKYPVYDFF